MSPAKKERECGSSDDQINRLFNKPAGKQIRHPKIKASIINFTGSLNLSDLIIKAELLRTEQKLVRW